MEFAGPQTEQSQENSHAVSQLLGVQKHQAVLTECTTAKSWTERDGSHYTSDPCWGSTPPPSLSHLQIASLPYTLSSSSPMASLLSPFLPPPTSDNGLSIPPLLLSPPPPTSDNGLSILPLFLSLSTYQ